MLHLILSSPKKLSAILIHILLTFSLFVFLVTLPVFVRANEVSVNPTNRSEALTQPNNKLHIPGRCRLVKQKRIFFLLPGQNNNALFRFSINTTTNSSTVISQEPNTNQSINILRQLETANALYTQVLGLINPLEQPRYQRAEFINVTYESAPRPFGRAYDEVIADKALGLAHCFIAMKISTQTRAPYSITPAHELFHLYQNGYMMFKQRWLTEGLARWAETLFTKGDAATDEPLPQTKSQLLQVMRQSYGAKKMWIRLFQQIDNHGEFQVPADIADKKYLSGKPVLKDNKAYGTGFIRILFEHLAEKSLALAQEKGWSLYNWTEAQQRNPDDNPVIWKAIQQAVTDVVPVDKQNTELHRFIAISLDD